MQNKGLWDNGLARHWSAGFPEKPAQRSRLRQLGCNITVSQQIFHRERARGADGLRACFRIRVIRLI